MNAKGTSWSTGTVARVKKVGKGWVAKPGSPGSIDSGKSSSAALRRPGAAGKPDARPRSSHVHSLGNPASVSSETYMCIGPFESESKAENVTSYISCRLTRFLIMLHKPSQHATKVYTFVPTQDWSKPWTDAEALREVWANARGDRVR